MVALGIPIPLIHASQAYSDFLPVESQFTDQDWCVLFLLPDVRARCAAVSFFLHSGLPGFISRPGRQTCCASILCVRANKEVDAVGAGGMKKKTVDCFHEARL